jgi:hypothetical protein
MLAACCNALPDPAQAGFFIARFGGHMTSYISRARSTSRVLTMSEKYFEEPLDKRRKKNYASSMLRQRFYRGKKALVKKLYTRSGGFFCAREILQNVGTMDMHTGVCLFLMQYL